MYESNGLLEAGHYYSDENWDRTQDYTLAELAAAGGKVTRVRLLTEVWPGMGRVADISYIHGEVNGKLVQINLSNCDGVIGTMLRDMKKEFIAWAKREKVFAKGLGLLDEGNWSVVY